MILQIVGQGSLSLGEKSKLIFQLQTFEPYSHSGMIFQVSYSLNEPFTNSSFRPCDFSQTRTHAQRLPPRTAAQISALQLSFHRNPSIRPKPTGTTFNSNKHAVNPMIS